MSRSIVLAAVIGCVLAAPAFADIVHLKNGKQLEGTVVRTADRIEVHSRFGKVFLKPDDVLRIEERADLQEVYRARRAKLAKDDVDGLFELALWLDDAGWKPKAREEYANVLKLAPDHRGAHHALGHVRYEGEWMSEDEAMKAQGYVRHDGRWVTAEERALLMRDKTYRDRVLGLQRKVDKLVRAMASPSRSVRSRYHRQLVTLAREVKSAELEKAANEVKAWYDEAYAVLASRALMEVRATMATLKRPIPTFTTSLGAGTTPVTLQLPELAVVSIGTTVNVPLGR